MTKLYLGDCLATKVDACSKSLDAQAGTVWPKNVFFSRDNATDKTYTCNSGGPLALAYATKGFHTNHSLLS